MTVILHQASNPHLNLAPKMLIILSIKKLTLKNLINSLKMEQQEIVRDLRQMQVV